MLLIRAAAVATLLAAGASASELEGFWQGEAVHQQQSWPVAVRIALDATRPVAEIDLPAMGVFGHRAGSVTEENGDIRFGAFVRDDRLRFSVRQTGGAMHGTLEAFGVTAEFTAERDPGGPILVRREDLEFWNGEIRLAGTLILPQGQGPHPAIVLTHGSGSQSRNTTLYASFGVFLARNGVAALIYDKRGAGKSTGDWEQATLVDLANDALAGVEALRQRADILSNRVGCGGASQGGWVAPLCASLSPNVAFVIVNSAPGVSPAEQNNFNCETDMRSANMPQEVIDQALDLRRRADAYFATGTLDSSLNGDLQHFHQRYGDTSWCQMWIHTPPLPSAGPGTAQHYAADYMVLDPARLWPQIRVPVLAQWGADDKLVPAIASHEIIKASLDAAGNAHTRLVVHPGAGHGLGVTRNAASFQWPRLAPEYLPEVSAWIAKELKN